MTRQRQHDPVTSRLVEGIRAGIGNAIRAERWVRRRWTLAVMAQKTGLSPGYLSQIERGQRNLTLDVLKMIALAFNMKVWELIKAGEEEEDRLPPTK